MDSIGKGMEVFALLVGIAEAILVMFILSKLPSLSVFNFQF
jgi:hypothetical protein